MYYPNKIYFISILWNKKYSKINYIIVNLFLSNLNLQHTFGSNYFCKFKYKHA